MVHGWFCGYFPYDNPKYAMAVLVENGGSGSRSAVPLFGQIAEEITKFYPIQ
jgi:cell division protein FtsI/penicillin-binding protein 2